MSFLEEGDAQEALQVALAFVDAYDDFGSSTDFSASSSSNSPDSQTRSSYSDFHTLTSGEDEDEVANFIAELDAFSERRATPNSTLPEPATRRHSATTNKRSIEAAKRFRAKKKAEAAVLRSQVAQLESMLNQLQLARRTGNSSLRVQLRRVRSGDSRGVSPSGSVEGSLLANIQPKKESPWQDIAAAQADERHRSQTLNAKLREAVAKKAKLIQSLEAILGKRATLDGSDLLRDEQTQSLHNGSMLPPTMNILTELQRRVDQMYLTVDSLFNHPSWAAIADSVLCSSRLLQDPVCGATVELRMNAPLRCGVHEAGETLWQRTIEASTVIQTPKYCMKTLHLSKTSYQKFYTIVLDNGRAGSVELRGTAYVQRFSDAHRFAYVWASVILSSQEGECFREKGCMVTSRSSANAHFPTLFQGYYQLSGDTSSADATSLLSREQRGFVLKTLGSRTQAQIQLMQDMLLDEFAGFQPGGSLLLSR